MHRARARGGDLRKIDGLVVREKDRWFATPPVTARPELDSYPMPARHLIAQYAYKYYINFRKPLALMETARGFPFKVQFLLGLEISREHVPREITGARGEGAAGHRRAERLHHRRHPARRRTGHAH